MQAIRTDDLSSSFPLTPTGAGRLQFGLDDLHDVRSLVAVGACAGGLSPSRVSDLVVAAPDRAANSVLHGGGRGLATVWDEDGAVFVEVADAGTITDPDIGRERPDPTAQSGRGLYIA